MDKITSYRSILRKCNVVGLDEAQPNQIVDIYGIIASFKDVKKVKGRDYSQAVTITDPTIQGRSLNAMFFQDTAEKLPQVAKNRLIVIKNIKMNTFNKNLQPVCQKNITIYTTFELEDLQPYHSSGIQCDLDETDMHILRGLRAFYRGTSLESKGPSFTHRGRPTLRTDQLATDPSKFFDYVGMVVQCVPEESTGASKTNLLLTDFTINPNPYYTDDDGVRGISCDMLLQCTLWDNQSEKCPPLFFGDFVQLTNCTRNLRRGVLEIAIRGNAERKHQVHVIAPDMPSVADLLRRKGEYTPIPPRREEELMDTDEEIIPVVRTSLPMDSTAISLKEIWEKEETGVYVTRAYIKDYKPKDIRKWIRGWCSKCQKTFDDVLGTCSLCQSPLPAIYQFCMLLEDDEMKLLVYAFERDAAKLFREIPAEDAYKDAVAFRKLEDIIHSATSNDKGYLDLCIKSYDTLSGRNYQITETELIMDTDD